MKDLVVLYQEMSDMTSPICESECAHPCRKLKYRCCTIDHCKEAQRFAREKYGVELQPTGNPDLLFMGEFGCVVPPHLRPVCTLHVCPISYADQSCIGGSVDRTRDYFSLRDQILSEAEKQDKSPKFV